MSDLLDDASVDSAMQELLDNECENVPHEIPYTQMKDIAKNICRENQQEFDKDKFDLSVVSGIVSGQIGTDPQTMATFRAVHAQLVNQVYSDFTGGRITFVEFNRRKAMLGVR